MLACLLPGVLLLVLMGPQRRVRGMRWALGALWAGHAIRHPWQGPDIRLAIGIARGEPYAYTFALLLAGATTPAAALRSARPDLRRIGLALVRLAAAKAFLIDAAALVGLLRAKAFPGLGLTLAGLAWLNSGSSRGKTALRQAGLPPRRCGQCVTVTGTPARKGARKGLICRPLAVILPVIGRQRGNVRLRLLLLPSLALFTLTLLAACAAPSRPLVAPDESAQSISWLFLDAEGPTRRDIAFRFAAHPDLSAGVAMQSISRGPLPLSVTCNGSARLRDTPWGIEPAELGQHPGWAGAGTTLSARLGPRARDRLVLDLSPEVTRCQLFVQTGAEAGYNLTLERDESAAAHTAGDAQAPARPVATRQGDALAAAFHAPRALAMTAALPAGELRLLPGFLESLNARIEALTGAAAPEALLETGDPDIPLDFSNAPALDAIYISYLYIAADFSGALLARMLAWHAERGTEIRILVSDPLYGRAERALFEPLLARYPNIQMQTFRFLPERGAGAEKRLARVHRNNHTKLLLTQAHDPSRSRAIIGGRNWHDSYFFLEPHDLRAFPPLRDYATMFGWSWLHFRPFDDIEVEFTAPELVAATAAQFLDLWHRDLAANHPIGWPRPAPAPSPGITERGSGIARHFLSIPWVDDLEQIDLFVDLIDAAREEIHIATPFLNLIPELEAALERAVARGVQVRLVATVQREGLDGFYLNFVQREFIRDWAGRMALYDFVEGELTLHAKIFVFDRRVSVITATNLNQRSFLHDLENGLMVMDPRFAAQSVTIVEDYIRRGRRVDVSEGGAEPGGLGAILLRHSWLRRLL